MKILDRVLVLANNSIMNQIKNNKDFKSVMEAVKSISIAMHSQTELQKIETTKQTNSTSKELEQEEDNFFKEMLKVKVIDVPTAETT